MDIIAVSFLFLWGNCFKFLIFLSLPSCQLGILWWVPSLIESMYIIFFWRSYSAYTVLHNKHNSLPSNSLTEWSKFCCALKKAVSENQLLLLFLFQHDEYALLIQSAWHSEHCSITTASLICNKILIALHMVFVTVIQLYGCSTKAPV